jgi:hypothetical protein
MAAGSQKVFALRLDACVHACMTMDVARGAWAVRLVNAPPTLMMQLRLGNWDNENAVFSRNAHFCNARLTVLRAGGPGRQ